MSVCAAFILPHPPLIIPQIGKDRREAIRKTVDAFEAVALKIAAIRPDTIVLTTPHGVMYSDYLHISPGAQAKGDFASFGAREVSFSVTYDQDLVRQIARCADDAGIPAGTLGERDAALDHGSMVPLHFIDKAYRDYRLVRISLSGLSALDHYRFGKCVERAAGQLGRKTVLVASGDLSHKLTKDGPYGYAKEGPLFDRQITLAMQTADFLRFLTFEDGFCEAAAECGLRSFQIMAGALDGKAIKSELLSYEGPFGVGYAVAAYEIVGENESRRFDGLAESDPYVRLARQSLEHYVKTGRFIRRPTGLPRDMLEKKAGVFVSLKMNNILRGCIGTISPVEANLADEIIKNAVSAGLNDPRFEPVTKGELPLLVYSVDVLGEAEPIATVDELDAGRFGLIVSLRGRRGLLLPNLEGVDTPRQQVRIALQKAGIAPGEPYQMERFEVVRHK